MENNNEQYPPSSPSWKGKSKTDWENVRFTILLILFSIIVMSCIGALYCLDGYENVSIASDIPELLLFDHPLWHGFLNAMCFFCLFFGFMGSLALIGFVGKWVFVILSWIFRIDLDKHGAQNHE